MWYRIVSADNDSAFKNAMSQEMVPGSLRKIWEGHARPITKNGPAATLLPGGQRPSTDRAPFQIKPNPFKQGPLFDEDKPESCTMALSQEKRAWTLQTLLGSISRDVAAILVVNTLGTLLHVSNDLSDNAGWNR